MEFDFGGYVTRFNLVCSDGRTIRPNAFKHMDGAKVPLVWRHNYDTPDNILGHAVLEYRDDGMYGYAKFNSTERGQLAHKLVEEKNLDQLSIYANGLVHEGANVVHGNIREVSLVIAGANPGAFIDNVVLSHEDGLDTESEDEAIVRFGDQIDILDEDDEVPDLSADEEEEEDLSHSDEEEDEDEEDEEEDDDMEDEDGEETIADILDTMNEKQLAVVLQLVEDALKEAKKDQGKPEGSDDNQTTNKDGEDSVKHSDEEGSQMKTNVFDGTATVDNKNALTHEQMAAIFEDAKKNTKSLKESVLAHAENYGIKNIETLFPEAKNIRDTPDFVSRRMEWVSGVLNEVHKSPFARIRSRAADITTDEARARGYVKGNMKTEEVFSLLQRTTGPTTIYKKQKLDRDDILDITDFDVVMWLRAEMRVMLDEEIARAILVGDGRPVMAGGRKNEEKIDEKAIRPIWTDDDFYAYHHVVKKGLELSDVSDEIARAMSHYRGSGSPTLYAPREFVTDLLLEKDKLGRRLYESKQALANAFGVAKIVEMDIMSNLTRKDDKDKERELLGIIVNLRDYTVGADKGGNVSLFDDFDIDYNQYKYLIETRMSGTLTLPRSAVVIERGEVTAPKPAFQG